MTEIDPGVSVTEVGGTRPTRGHALGPEALATLLAVLIIGLVTAGLLLGTTPVTTAGPGGSPTPGPSTRASASAAPAYNLADIANALEIDRRLVATREELRTELKAATIDASAIAISLRRANADLLAGIDVADRLTGRPGTADIGNDLGAIYSDTHDRIDAALANSVRNAAAYHDAAVDVVASLARLDPIDTLLEALRNGEGAPPPSASAPPPASGSPPAATASAPPTAPPTVPPSSGPVGSGTTSPPPSGGAANVIVNGGFEAGVGAPWELVVTPPASATLTADTAIHASGARAARVDIAVGGDERAAVAVRQGGVSIQAGGHYLATIALRAATTREIRVRVASAAGDTYGTRLFVIGSDWQTVTLDFTPFATDPNAYLQVDLGRSAATVWLDDASFGQLPPTAG
ncbi:MAG TPA: carbohydrate binding domain-containing protein [Candidatus Limnocylindrales bacterium]|nr:carbohydrate binding domain-containing protein [Candidatus Limnocylindrales bacterium]